MNPKPGMVTPELISILSDCDVPLSVLNVFATAGVLNTDDLLGANDMMLRSLGVRKGPRVKLNHWICTQLCHFNMHIYSRNLDVGKPMQIRSSIEYHEWEPFLNKPLGPSDMPQFQKLAVLLAGSGIQLQNVALVLNVPFSTFKAVLIPVNPRRKKESGEHQITWREQVPKFDDKALLGQGAFHEDIMQPPPSPPPVPSPPPSRPITPALAMELGILDPHIRDGGNSNRRSSVASAESSSDSSRQQRNWAKQLKRRQQHKKTRVENTIMFNSFPQPNRTAARAQGERMAVVLKPSTAHMLGQVSALRDEEHNPTTFASTVASSALASASTAPGQTVVAVVTTSTLPAASPLTNRQHDAQSAILGRSSSSSLGGGRVRPSASLGTSTSGRSEFRRSVGFRGSSSNCSSNGESRSVGTPGGAGRFYSTPQGLTPGLSCLPTSGGTSRMTALGQLGLASPKSFIASVTTTTTAVASGRGDSNDYKGHGCLGTESVSVVFPTTQSSPRTEDYLRSSNAGPTGHLGCGGASGDSINRLVTGRNSKGPSFSERLRYSSGFRSPPLVRPSTGGSYISPAVASKFKPVYW